MQNIEHDLAKIQSIERKLSDILGELASELRKPVSERDVDRCQELWAVACISRPKLNKICRDYRAEIGRKNPKSGLKARRRAKQRREINQAHARTRLWSKMAAVVDAQIEPSRRPFQRIELPLGQNLNTYQVIQELFIDAMFTFANPHKQSQAACEHGCHKDIPLPMTQFAENIGNAYRICLAMRKPRPLRFLDVGCGGGTKVLAATTCFDLCDGLEYDDAYARAAQKMLQTVAPSRCQVFHGDALTFEHYDAYDVIYFYRPIVDHDKLRQMETRIIRQARPGTLIIAPYDIVGGATEPLNVVQMTGSIFLTDTPPDEAAHIKSEVEYVGSAIMALMDYDAEQLGYWSELWDASIGNGYGF